MGADRNFHRADATTLEKICAESSVSSDWDRGVGHRDRWNFPTRRPIESLSRRTNSVAFIDDGELKQVGDARSGQNGRRRAWGLFLYETSARALRRAARVCGSENARLPRLR